LPVFAWGCATAAREHKPLFVFYALPALILVGVHGAMANHYPRYNLGFIGPISVGAAWLILRGADALRKRRAMTTHRPEVAPTPM
jgi:hypothetical protein